jgi:hypothetical protein
MLKMALNKQDLIKNLVENYGYDKEDIKLLTNGKLQGLIKQEEFDAKELETESTRVVAKKSKIKDEDRIVVMNGLTGALVYHSERTNRRWEFTTFGQQDTIEYGELVAMKNRYPRYFTEGWLIVLDKQVQEEFNLTEMYKNIITPENADTVFKMDVDELDKFVDGLPDGMKTSFVNMAMEKVGDGTLDSSKVRKYIQEKFNFNFDDNAPQGDLVSEAKTDNNGIIIVDKR